MCGGGRERAVDILLWGGSESVCRVCSPEKICFDQHVTQSGVIDEALVQDIVGRAREGHRHCQVAAGGKSSRDGRAKW